MTPIEQVKPPTPGNWVRRPDSRVKRGNPDGGKQHHPQDQDRPGQGKGQGNGQGSGPAGDGREHIVDELA